MSWTRVIFLSMLSTLLVFTFSVGVKGAVVPDNGKASDSKGASRHVFMPESDASSFFKHRGRRSVREQAEYQAELRVRLSADERRREYNEEQRNEFENFVEEERDEQHERTREKNEQWREFNYDGHYPRYHWYH